MNHTIFQKVVFVFIAFFVTHTVFAQKAEIIDVTRKGSKIEITYEISKAKYDQVFDVSLYVSKDGGNKFIGPLKAVSGDIGKSVLDGEHKISWTFLEDINSLEGDIVFDVRAKVIEPEVKKKLFVSWCGNMDSPIGIMVGSLGKTGFYGAFRTTGISKKKADYTYDTESWEPEFNQAQYYSFNDKELTRRFSVTGGITQQLGRDFFTYVGAGYGVKKLLWQIDIYDYGTGEKNDDAYVEQPDYSYSGLELEGGAMFRMGSLLISLGATTVNFEYSNVLVGVGWAF